MRKMPKREKGIREWGGGGGDFRISQYYSMNYVMTLAMSGDHQFGNKTRDMIEDDAGCLHQLASLNRQNKFSPQF